MDVLDSKSSGFKEENSEERKRMEEEAAKLLMEKMQLMEPNLY